MKISSIKRNNKKVNSCKRITSFKDSNLFKNIKKKNFEEKKEGEVSSYKVNKSKPNRIYSLRNYASCKNMNLKSSLFNTNMKSSLFKKKNQTTKNLDKNHDVDNHFNNFKSICENGKKRNKSKNKKVINNNIKEKDCVSIIIIKNENTDNKDSKDNKDNNKSNKNIKKLFCCL